MIRNNPDMVYDMTDTVNLQYQTGGYQIYRTRMHLMHIASEWAEDGSILIFGEYAFYLILKNLARKSEYSLKIINCPFIKRIAMTDTFQILFKNAPELEVSVNEAPECMLESIDIKPAGKSQFYRMSLSYRVEMRIPEKQKGPSLSIDGNPSYERGVADATDESGSVKVWRVDSDNKHTVEQLLGIDQDTLKHFNKNQK